MPMADIPARVLGLRTRPEPPTRRPSKRAATTLSAIVAVVSLCAAAMSCDSGPVARTIQPNCTVSTSVGKFSLGLTQMSNASIIAAVGQRLGMPNHAVTVALATALQESGMRNLPGGDRDSVGLFQQRPSQGWGTPTQLMDPTYAATAFYNALVQVPGWETMAVADAAQAVQHSAAPSAYAAQETEGRSLAVALTGEEPAAVSCTFQPSTSSIDPAWRTALSAQLASSGPGAAVDPTTGWVLSGWLVAHAHDYGFTSVSFAGKTWRPTAGAWQQGGPNDGVVRVS